MPTSPSSQPGSSVNLSMLLHSSTQDSAEEFERRLVLTASFYGI
jgi:hypothetical protein